MARAIAAAVLALGVASTTAVTTLASTAAAATIATVPDTIPTDCSIDVTVPLQAFIDSVPDEATLEFTPGACYVVNGTLTVQRRHGLVFHGNGATFRQTTDGTALVNPRKIRARNVWSFVHDDRITVERVIVRGANPYAGVGDKAYQPIFEAQNAFNILGTTNMVMDHVEAYDVYGDFVWVGPGTNGLTVQYSTFARNGRQGWTINGSNITFQFNRISDTRRATIDMEPSSPLWASHNVTIQNNEVGRGRLLFFASVGAGNAPIDNVNILNNHLTRTFAILICSWGLTRSHYRIIGNHSDSAGVSGTGGVLSFRNVSDVLVKDNYQRTQPAHRLLDVGARDVNHLVITGNVFPWSKGVWVDHGGNVDVRQWNNSIGNPLQVPPASLTHGPTPIPPPAPVPTA